MPRCRCGKRGYSPGCCPSHVYHATDTVFTVGVTRAPFRDFCHCYIIFALIVCSHRKRTR